MESDANQLAELMWTSGPYGPWRVGWEAACHPRTAPGMCYKRRHGAFCLAALSPSEQAWLLPPHSGSESDYNFLWKLNSLTF